MTRRVPAILMGLAILCTVAGCAQTAEEKPFVVLPSELATELNGTTVEYEGTTIKLRRNGISDLQITSINETQRNASGFVHVSFSYHHDRQRLRCDGRLPYGRQGLLIWYEPFQTDRIEQR